MADPFAIGGALEILYGLVAVVFAGVVYKAAPRNWTNKTLAILLLVDGATSGGLVVGLNRFIDGEAVSHAMTAVQFLGNGSRPFLYLAFIATAFPVAWTRILDNGRGRGLLFVLAAVAGISCALLGVQYPLYKDGLQLLFILVGLLGFASSLWAYLRASGNSRDKIRAYLQAFSIRDLGALVLLPIRDLAADGSMVQGWTLVAVKVVYVAFVCMVAYGVLLGQIVNLDASARTAFTRTAAITVVAAIFIVVTEVLEGMLPYDQLPFNETAVALAVSVLMAFMFQPIQDHTEGLALKLFPGQSISADEYALAVERAVDAGTISPGEQATLDAIWQRHR